MKQQYNLNGKTGNKKNNLAYPSSKSGFMSKLGSQSFLGSVAKKSVQFALVMMLCFIGLQKGTAQLITSEDFTSYPEFTILGNGTSINATTGFQTESAPSTFPIKVAGSNTTFPYTPTTFSYTGHPASGTYGVIMNNNGDDERKWQNINADGTGSAFTAVTSGSVYGSFLVNMKTVQTGDYFFELNDNTLYALRVFAKASGSGYVLGVAKNGTPPAADYNTTTLNLNQTYLVVVKYTFNTTSGTDDQVSLWINPTLGYLNEPTNTTTGAYNVAPTTTSGQTDPTKIDGFSLRQGSSSTAPTQQVGGVRMGTTWASVTPSNLLLTSNYFTGFTYAQGAGASSYQQASFYGSNLTSNGTITITAPTDYEVASTVDGSGVPNNWGASVTISYSGTSISRANSKTFYVRLKAGLNAGSYNNELVGFTDGTVASPGAAPTSINAQLSVSGIVTPASCTTASPATGFAAASTNNNAQEVLTWTNGTCYNDVIVVAKSSSFTTGTTPSGDGSSLVVNSSSFTDGLNSTFDGGVIVYKGNGTSVTVTGLTNNNTYYFEVISRFGSTWALSTTQSITAIPVAPNYFWNGAGTKTGTVTSSGGTGTWNVAGSWVNNNSVATTASSASGTATSWSNGSSAIFGGTAGTITVDASKTTAGCYFNTTGYTLTTTSTFAVDLLGTINLASGVNLNLGPIAAAPLSVYSVPATYSNTSLTITGSTPSGNTITINLLGNNPSIAVPTKINITPNGGTSGIGGYVALSNATVSGDITNQSSGAQTMLGGVGSSVLTVSGKIHGSTGVIFTTSALGGGDGTVLLTNNGNDYTGGTYFNNTTTGVVKLGVTNALPTNTDLYMSNLGNYGGVLDLNGYDQTIASLFTTNTAGGGKITNNSSLGNPSVLTVTQAGSPQSFGFPIVDGLGTIGLVKNGTGTLILTGTGHSISGGIKINTGELRFNPSSASISTNAPVTFNGGTFGTTGITANSTLSFKTVTLTDNSIIDLATSSLHSINFTSSNNVNWTSGKTLTIYGWQGNYDGTTGSFAKIFFGSSATGLTAGQLAQIQFNNGTVNTPGVNYPATILSTGEVVATCPRPTVSFTASAATACTGSNTTYTTQAGFSGYVWTFSGTANTDYTILAGGNSTSNTVDVKWLTGGSKTVSVNYNGTLGCAAVSATTTTTVVTALPTATISYSAASYTTITAGTYTPSLSGTNAYTGGTYSVNPSGLTINSTTGAITPTTSSVGAYTVTYTLAAAGGCSVVNATSNVNITSPTAQSQTINFTAFTTPVVYGSSTFNLTATATSNLAVSFASSNTAVATVSGNTVTIVGEGSTTITATQSGGTSNSTLYNPATSVTKTLVVSPASIYITAGSITPNNKVYDRTTTATYSGTPTLTGAINGDVSFITINAGSASFATATVGASKVVSYSGFSISGSKAHNYSLVQPLSSTASITKKSVYIISAAAANKQSDGTNNATITGTLSGIISPDVVSFNGTGTFASTSVGTNIAVTSTATLTGTDAGNYSLVQPTGLTANITTPVATLTEVLVPQYIQGQSTTVGALNTNRIPYAFRVKLSNLKTSTTYRYYTSALEISEVVASTSTGVPNWISVEPTVGTGGTFTRITSGDLSTNYKTFTTDANGSYTGWFVIEPTGNVSRYLPGTNLFMRITTNDGTSSTTAVNYLATTSKVKVLDLQAGQNGASPIYFSTLGQGTTYTPKNFVMLWDNTAGTGRPIAGTYVEDDGVANTVANSYAAFYGTLVNAIKGSWGTLIPNKTVGLSNGIRRIQEYALADGSAVGCAATDADGVWATGVSTTVDTRNTTGGITPLALTSSASLAGGAAFVPSGVSVWQGADGASANDSNNWCNGLTTTSTILVNDTRVPKLNADLVVNGAYFVSAFDLNGNSLTANGGIVSTGKIKGSRTSSITINNTGIFKVPNTLSFDSTIDGTTNALKNLTINIPATLDTVTTLKTKLKLYGVFAPNASRINTNDSLTLKSVSIDTTAVVDAVSGTITGKVTVERFIPKGLRAYRQIGAEVANAGSVFANWQEGGVNTNGYGTQITGTNIFSTNAGVDATTGFDYLKYYAGFTTGGSFYTDSNNVWSVGAAPNYYSNISSTKNLYLNPFAGYELLIRGNRTLNLFQVPQPSAMISNVILRATGNLITGTVNYSTTGITSSGYSSTYHLSTGANSFSFIANPYVAPINWISIYNRTKATSNITSSYWYLDPTFEFGSIYVTYNAVSQTSSNPDSSKMNQYIQPGQAFFVQNKSTSSAPSFTIQESDKVAASTKTAVFGVVAKPNRIAVALYKNNRNVDGAVAVFSNDFTSSIGDEDSRKVTNSTENIAIVEGGNELSIDGLANPVANDVVALKLSQMVANTNYELHINTNDFVSNGVSAYLNDKFSNTQTLLTAGVNTIAFTATSNAATYNNRFEITFKATSPLAANKLVVKAAQKGENINVEWNVTNENNVASYQVEKSINGKEFNVVNEAKATNNNTVASYNWLDTKAVTGNNYYRIKTIGFNGQVVYSNVVLVTIGTDSKEQIAIYPNPVNGSTFGLQMTNVPQGTYNVSLYNTLGQLVINKTIVHNGGAATQTIELGTKLSSGVYTLKVVGSNGISNQLELIAK